MEAREKLMSIVAKMDAEFKRIEETKKALVEELRPDFKPVFVELLNKSETLESISWRQYTPYWCDGDTCEFHVYNDELTINEDGDEYEFSYLQEFVYTDKLMTEQDLLDCADYGKMKGYSHLQNRKIGENGYVRNPESHPDAKIFSEIKALLNSVPEVFYQELFGDHVEITIYRDGRLEVRGYEHE